MSLCNECYKKGEKVQMVKIGEVKPKSLESKGSTFSLFCGIEGKPKWKCPKCGYERKGRGESWADMEENKRKY